MSASRGESDGAIALAHPNKVNKYIQNRKKPLGRTPIVIVCQASYLLEEKERSTSQVKRHGLQLL